MADRSTIDQDILALQQAGEAGTLALVHGGEPCDSAALTLSLSAFLIGAGSRAYFACTDGWQIDQGWNSTQRAAEYDQPLGPPVGSATRIVGSQAMAVVCGLCTCLSLTHLLVVAGSRRWESAVRAAV